MARADRTVCHRPGVEELSAAQAQLNGLVRDRAFHNSPKRDEGIEGRDIRGLDAGTRQQAGTIDEGLNPPWLVGLILEVERRDPAEVVGIEHERSIS